MIERLGPPPVEPLSDLAWARVERGLWSRLDAEPEVTPPTRSRWWIAGGVAAAAIAIAVIVTTRRADDPEVVQRDKPARMVSGASPSELTLDDAHVMLDPDSAVVVTRDAAATTAVLERGAAWFSIARRTVPFVVVAGDAVVTVVGTRFRVARAGDQASVEVARGIVDVRFRGAERRLIAGDSWSSEPVTIAPPPIAPDAAGPQPPIVSGPPTAKPESARPPIAKPPATKPPATDARRVELERLSVLEVRDPAAAITGYLALAADTDRWAELALFAAGRLAADRRDPRARTLLDTYLKRFPRGANADDARELLGHLKGPSR